MKKTVVLYPGLAVSHFVPMVQLADAFLEDGYAVTVALIDPAHKQDIAFVSTVARVIASSKPSVTFHTLPPIQNPPTVPHGERFLASYLDLLSRYNQHLHDLLRSLPAGSVHALVADVLSFEALDVARKLGVPAYTFYAAGASALAVSFQLASTNRSSGGGGDTPLKEIGDDTPLTFRGVPPVPASHLMAEQLESPDTETYKSVMRGITEPDGLLLNSFEAMEPRAVAALRDPQCCPAMAPVYCVGPLVAGEEKATTGVQRHECLAWLDAQPDRSVVFLCFGSIGMTTHSAKQLGEIAVGLEKSGHRFLWVVRAPPPDDDDDPEKKPKPKPFDPRADPDLATLLPGGFLERTRGRGVVVKLWAPQVDVLRHRATGAFVTHCGWNSVLEGVLAGVPMLCWPMYAEQKMNKVFMVEEFGIGVGVDGWQQHGLVTAEEVDAKVRLVMGSSDEAERLRARVAEHREAAAVAWKDGGSSRRAFSRFLADASGLRLGPAPDPAARRT